ncbi:MAG: apolipoprotein N-acyltransferase [Candidatus Cloacimonadaceae bacterium]
MKKTLLILLSALLLGLSRLPLYSGWLGFFALVPLFYYFDWGRHTWKELFRDAFVYSAVSLILWMHWIWGVTAPGFVGIIIFYAVAYFLAFLAVQLIWQKLPKFKYIGFMLIFITLEYIQNFTEFRFAWINLGYALTDYTVLLQAADLGGVVLLSLFLLLSNIFIYQMLHKKMRYLLYLAILMLLWTGYGIWRMQTLPLQQKEAQITVMQPSIPQSEKWEQDHFDELYARYVDLTAKAAQDSAQLIIWPEAAMPAYVLRQSEYRIMVQSLADANQIDIFTGFPDVLPAPINYPGGAYYYNAATLFKPHRNYAPPYYKIILVPVAERTPLLHLFPFLWKMQFGQANWEYGTEYLYFSSAGTVFSPQICFEIAFAELNRKMAFRNLGEGSGNKPDKIDYLVNITNDAWFGRSAGPWIHGMMTKFRAIENRIQIYRSANTGISMAVDPLGRVIKKTRLFAITNLEAPLYTCARVPLYYYLYWWPRLFCLLAAALILMAIIYRKTPDPAQGEKK